MFEKRSGTKFVAKVDCDCGNVRLKPYRDKLIVACPCKPPRYITENGEYQEYENATY